jgi:hypothetical protein
MCSPPVLGGVPVDNFISSQAGAREPIFLAPQARSPQRAKTVPSLSWVSTTVHPSPFSVGKEPMTLKLPVSFVSQPPPRATSPAKQVAVPPGEAVKSVSTV